jgi:hypothetical protein
MNSSKLLIHPAAPVRRLAAWPNVFRPAALRAGLGLAASLIANLAHAQSNYATPYFFTTLAGVNTTGSSDGTGNAARFNTPQGVAVDAAGNVYVADTASHTIRKITFFGAVTTLAGQANSPGTTNGSGSAARFTLPRGVALDSAGNVYVADTSNHAIRKITPAGAVTTLAGGSGGSVDGTGAAARFSSPNSVAVDASGTVYVADTANNTIRKITPAGVVTTLAGVAGSFGSTDGTGAGARFASPRGVAVDGSGNVYVADRDNNTVRKITSAGVVTTLAGTSNGFTGSTDGTGTAARFHTLYSVAAEANGTVYVADSSNKLIRKIAPNGVVTTLAGLVGAVGSTDGTGNVVRFADPQGIAVDGRGNLYVADTNGHTIRMSVFPPDFTTHPLSQVVTPGASVTLTAGATSNVPITYQWQKDGNAIAGATTTSVNVSNIQASNLGNYTLVATNMAGASTSNAGVLSFTPPPSFATQPSAQTVTPGSSATFVANATSTLPITYQWHKDNVAIAGATTTTFNVSNVQTGHLGNYTLVATNSVGSTTSNPAALSFVIVASNAGRLINLSILTSVPNANDTFTMGYVVGGSGTTGTKPLVIRAAGPSLGALGVTGTLGDPRIELFAGTAKTGENDNWGGSAAISTAMASVGAFPYTGPTSLDAASVASITSADNSVKVSATGNGTGMVIAEIYDATPTADFTATTPRLLNVSVLKHLGSGLTMGFVIGGSQSKAVLIRAVGPTLGAAPFSVPGVVADPQLTLLSGQTIVAANDNWNGTPALTAAFGQVGAFALPATSRDAALVATLAPGEYTVQVSGVGNTTGTAIVEVYEIP